MLLSQVRVGFFPPPVLTDIRGFEKQAGHVSIILVPWEGTRRSVAAWLRGCECLLFVLIRVA